MTHPTIDDVFNKLDEWRHYAGFPLEARAHPYFGLFLVEVFAEHLEVPVKPTIIPEIPYLMNDSNSQSPKVDFLALSSDCKCAYLIEVKTDMNYLDQNQGDKLATAAANGINHIMGNIRRAANPTKKSSRMKYQCLLNALDNLEVQTSTETKVIYILPRMPVSKKETNDVAHVRKFAKILYFKEVARVVKRHGALGERFAQSLCEWATVDAGNAGR